MAWLASLSLLSGRRLREDAKAISTMINNSRKLLHRQKWVKQRDQHSCVPVAILNLLKWSGHPVSYRKDFGFWSKQVNHTAEHGTHIRDYAAILARIPNVKVQRVTRPTVAEIDSALLAGCAVLLRSAWKANGRTERHLTLIVSRTKRSWFLTNTFRGHSWFSIKTVKKLYLEQHRMQSGVYPTAWFVNRENLC